MYNAWKEDKMRRLKARQGSKVPILIIFQIINLANYVMFICIFFFKFKFGIPNSGWKKRRRDGKRRKNERLKRKRMQNQLFR